MILLFMANLPIAVHVPRFDAVVVIETIRSGTKSPDRNGFLSGGLHVTGASDAPRLQADLASESFLLSAVRDWL
jgi:hypothetical protein